MFSWLKRSSRPARPRTPLRTRLHLEALETRDCPAGPVLTSFSVQTAGGTNVTLSGGLADDNPTACTVTFTGQVTGTATVDGWGDFTLTTTASGLGTVTARATDGAGLTGNQLQATITSTPPAITLNPGNQGIGGAIVFMGQVTVGTASGLTVTLGGAASGSAQTDANGNYAVNVPAANWSAGNVTARTTDVWGQASNTASATVTNAAPIINNFTASWGGAGLCTFQGQVVDEFAPGETVDLWGVPTLNGQQGYTSVTVNSNSMFIYTTPMTPQDQGMVSAEAFDWQGLASNVPSIPV